MARGYKLRPSTVRKIFSSTEPAPAMAKRFGVSTNLIYLIRQGRVHKKVTKGLAPAVRSKGTKSATPAIDLDALADAVIDRLVSRLGAKARSPWSKARLRSVGISFYRVPVPA